MIWCHKKGSSKGQIDPSDLETLAGHSRLVWNHAKAGQYDQPRWPSRSDLVRLMIFPFFMKSQSWHNNTLMWYQKSNGLLHCFHSAQPLNLYFYNTRIFQKMRPRHVLSTMCNIFQSHSQCYTKLLVIVRCKSIQKDG